MSKNLILILSIISILGFSCKKTELSQDEKEKRQQAIDDYNNIKRTNEVYTFSAENEPLSNCDKGIVNKEVLNKIITQLNYYRKLAGCAPLSMDSNFTKQCQAFLLTAISNKGATTINPSLKCYSLEAEAAWDKVISSSSYYTNFQSPISYFFSETEGNVVNRRFLLYPKLNKIGYGQMKTYFGIKVLGDESTDESIVNPEFVAWPPKGHIVEEMIPKVWSFMVPNADVRYASVSMKTRDLSKKKWKEKNLEMKDIAVSSDTKGWSTHLGNTILGEDPTILFQITGENSIDDEYENKDLEYEVTIKNVVINGIGREYNYKVTVVKQ